MYVYYDRISTHRVAGAEPPSARAPQYRQLRDLFPAEPVGSRILFRFAMEGDRRSGVGGINAPGGGADAYLASAVGCFHVHRSEPWRYFSLNRRSSALERRANTRTGEDDRLSGSSSHPKSPRRRISIQACRHRPLYVSIFSRAPAANRRKCGIRLASSIKTITRFS